LKNETLVHISPMTKSTSCTWTYIYISTSLQNQATTSSQYYGIKM